MVRKGVFGTIVENSYFIPTLGSGGPQWGLVKLIYPSVYLSLYLSVWLPASIFENHRSAARNCAQRMRPQATG